MYLVLATILLLFIIVTVIYGIVRGLLGAWLAHRVRLAILERLEADPGLVGSPEGIRTLLEGSAPGFGAQRQRDYLMTGSALAAIGVGFLVVGRLMTVGQLAVGVYLAGVICAGLGAFMALFGLLLRFLAGKSREGK